MQIRAKKTFNLTNLQMEIVITNLLHVKKV